MFSDPPHQAKTLAEDPLIILYTSGTTGKPKGIAHTHASFPIKAAQDMAFGTDVGRGTRICWYTDIGWMMGPWLIYGALINGATICIYDGAPDYPTPDRMWEFCAKHKVEVLGISPTLVRALAPKPSVLLLDEPLSALDLKLRKEMQSELKRLQQETGITFVLVTHDQEEALAMSDRIAVMRDGHILQIGRPKDIYDNPSCRFVADFIGEANLIPGPSLGRDPALTVTIRPERIHITQTGRGRVRGKISNVTFLGLDTLYEVTIDGDARIRVRRRESEDGFARGQSVALDWPATAERELSS